MGIVVFVVVVLLLITVLGIVKAIRSLRGALRIVLVLAGVLLSLFFALILTSAGLYYAYYRSVTETVEFDPAAYKGPTGRIVTPLTGRLSSRLWRTDSDGGTVQFSIRGVDGVFTAPAGEYRLFACYQDLTHKGVSWSVTSTLIRSFSVKPGSSVRLDIGPPYTASVRVASSGKNRIDLGLEITGRAGEKVSITRGGRGGEPGFRIISTSGKVLQEGRFRYG